MAFTARLQPELDRRLKEEAAARGLTKIQLVEAVLRQWLHEQEVCPMCEWARGSNPESCGECAQFNARGVSLRLVVS